MGLSCGAAVLAGAASASGVAAAPVTGGASLAVTVLTWAGAVATAAQCGIATGRVINELVDPRANDILDSEVWVQRSTQILDAVSLVGGTATDTPGGVVGAAGDLSEFLNTDTPIGTITDLIQPSSLVATITISRIPEPSTMALIAMGVGGALALARRRR